VGLFKKREKVPPPQPTDEQWALANAGLIPSVDALSPSLTATSDFIKRATCPRCGAPKTLPSKTAYLYCDYCGALVDYDFRKANAGTNAGLTNTIYHQLVAPWQPNLDHARATGDRDAYRGLMLHVFQQWIDQCPQAVSPRAKTDLDFRQRMVAYSAECAVVKDMDPTQQQMEAELNAVMGSFQRMPTPGGAWMVAGDFWRAAELWKQQMELAYQTIESTGVAGMDPDEAPPGVALKMEHSTFCQAWLPHLSAEDGERLLAYYGMKGDYTKVEPQVTEDHRCGGCGVELHTMPGARVVVCEDCGRQVDIAAGAVPCRQCGAPLSYPVGVTQLQCPYCRVQTARV
jgi:DNA-directed RNA polymerase subunit RPC12/RpoP